MCEASSREVPWSPNSKSYQLALLWKEKVECNLLLSQNVIKVVFYWFFNQTTTNCCWRIVFIFDKQDTCATCWFDYSFSNAVYIEKKEKSEFYFIVFI